MREHPAGCSELLGYMANKQCTLNCAVSNKIVAHRAPKESAVFEAQERLDLAATLVPAGTDVAILAAIAGLPLDAMYVLQRQVQQP